MKKTRYHVWMPSLGPSEKLLSDFRAEKINWREFSSRYRKEILADGPVDAKCKTTKNHGQKFTLRLLKQIARSKNVTLMCHCNEDQEHCHRNILSKMIKSV
jgi:uncharacterized protein YeaO (DUF488 family)